jgi:hypothetical protein
MEGNARSKEVIMDLKIGVYYSAYQQPRATYECLKSFRKHFPDAPIRLISNNGYDFAKMADFFKCDYVYEKVQTLTEKDPWYRFISVESALECLNRVKRTCEKFSDVDWIVTLEDDTLVRGPIKHMPPAPLSGPCTVEFQPAVIEFVHSKYPWLQVYGYSGCGGTIFHRESFLKCMQNIPDIEEARKLDDRIRWYGDALFTFTFLYNGFENGPAWLDQSEVSCGRGLPDAAFDHQYKVYYDQPWEDSMIGA